MGDFRRFGLRAALVCFVATALAACDISGGSRSQTDETLVSGVAQKGPLLAGGKLTATRMVRAPGGGFSRGEQVSVPLADDGRFEVQVPWHGPTEFEVDGRFFNELTQAESKQPATLSAMAEVADRASVNLNLFTTLEHRRLEVLLQQHDYGEAQGRASQELAALLGEVLPADSLDLTDGTSERRRANANLLLFSAAALKHFPEDDESEEEGEALAGLERLLADFARDGKIDDGGIRDWEGIIAAANRDLLDEAADGLGQKGYGEPLPRLEGQVSLPVWTSKLLVSVEDAFVVQEVEGRRQMRVEVRLSSVPKNLREPVSVLFSTAPGSAIPGKDYVHVQTRVEFDCRIRCEQSQYVTIPILANLSEPPPELELDERGRPGRAPEPKTIRLLLSEPENVELGRAEGIGSLINRSALPPDMLPVEPDFELEHLKLIALRDGERQLPLSGDAFYAQPERALSVELELKSSLPCPPGGPSLLYCQNPPDFSYTATVELLGGTKPFALASVPVAASEIALRGPLRDRVRTKRFILALDQPGLDAYLAQAVAEGKDLSFRVTAQVLTQPGTSRPAISVAAPRMIPHADSLNFGSAAADKVWFSEAQAFRCGSGSSQLPRFRVSGSADWRPSPEDWDQSPIAYDDLCVEMAMNSNGDAFVFSVVSGFASAAEATGYVGGVGVIALDNTLTRDGAIPTQLQIRLPNGHSWHAMAADGRPSPRGSQIMAMDLATSSRTGDYRTLSAGSSSGFFHAWGLPFSIWTDDLSLDPEGLTGFIYRLHYSFDQDYHYADPRHRDRQGPVSNDSRFARFTEPGGSAWFVINDEGLSIPQLEFGPGTSLTHFPRTELETDVPFQVSVVDGRFEDGQALAGQHVHRFSFDGECGGCVAGEGEVIHYQFTPASSSNPVLAADGAVALRARSSQEAAWGPYDSAADGRIFSRQGDAGREGVIYLPGRVAPGDGGVADYLLGARELVQHGTVLTPAAVYPLDHPHSRRGNHFMAGFTVGPQIYSDASGQPQVGHGQDLTGTSTRIGFGGLPSPSYRDIASNIATKYVLRPGGLTGVFNSDDRPGYIGAYGYELSLRRFGIRLVNNRLDDYSWLDGEVRVPGQGGFEISFSSLELTCTGNLGAGLIDREACDGIDNNGNGLTDENCGVRLAGWQAPSDLLSMSFQPEDPALGACVAQSRQLQVGHSLDLARLSRPVGLLANWSPDGKLLEHRVRSASEQQVDRPDEDGQGFALAAADMQLKVPTGRDDGGWVQFSGRLGVPFWQALKVDGRVANTYADEHSMYPEPTVLVAEGSLRGFADARDNAQLLTEMGNDDDYGDYELLAEYLWGGTGWGFRLPVHYDHDAVTKDKPRFLGHEQTASLLVLDAKAGINFIEPEHTRLSFGASADFTRLRDVSVDLQIDLSDPESLAKVDSLLNQIGIGGSPLSSALGALHERLDLMNSLVGPGLDAAIKRALLVAITQAGESVGGAVGGDPFELLAEAMGRVQTLPAQVANSVGERLSAAVDAGIAPLTGQLDRNLVDIYHQVPALIAEAPDPTGPARATLRENIRKIGGAGAALDEVDAVLAGAAYELESARAELAALRAEVSERRAQVAQALNRVKHEVLGPALNIAECRIDLVGGGISTENALLGPALESLKSTREVARAMQALELVELIGEPIANAAGVDPQPLVSAERQIRDLSRALDQRITQALEAAEDTLCPSGGRPSLASALTQAKDFLDDIQAGMASIDQRIDALHDQLNQPIDLAQERLAGARQRLGAGREMLTSLQDSLEALLDDLPELADYQGYAADQIQQAMDEAAMQAFGMPWVGEDGLSFAAVLALQMRRPVDELIADIQVRLQTQLGEIAAKVPVKSAEEMRRMVRDQILDTPPVQQLLAVVNNELAAIVGELNSVALLVLDQANHLVQTASRAVNARVNAALAEASSRLESGLPISAASMDGYALISGRELERAHLGAEWTMRGDSDDNTVSYNAALDITSWSANGKAEGCGVDVDEFGAPLDAMISTRNLPIGIGPAEVMIRKLYLGFTLQGQGGVIVPLGLFGGIETQGELDFQALTLYDIGFAAGTGAYENYLGASAEAIFGSVQMAAAFLVGKTCNHEVIEALDPQVAQFITLPGGVFNGAYVRGAASIPVWENGCALRIGVAADVGSWLLLSPTPTLGGLVGGGAYGTVACLGALRGQVTAMAEYSGGSISFAGEGFGVAGAGLRCKPETWTSIARSRENGWCGTVDASFGARYQDGWSIDKLNISGIH